MFRSHLCKAITIVSRRRSSVFPPLSIMAARFFSLPVIDRNQVKSEKRMSLGEVRKLIRLVNVEELKAKLVLQGKEVIGYGELLKACESTGIAKSIGETKEFVKLLDEAGVVL